MTKTVKYALVGALFIVLLGLVLELFRDPQKEEIRKKIAENQRLIGLNDKETDLHNEYIRDLNSIKNEIQNAVSGEPYDLKLMRAYFNNDAYYPKKLKKAYDDLYTKHSKALIDNRETYWRLSNENDSLLQVLEK